MTTLFKNRALLYYLCLTLIVVLSCSNEENIQEFDENSIAKSLVFKEVEINQTERMNSKKRFVFVGWDEWGRKKKDCRGWGLCNAKWFYCEDENGNTVPCGNENRSTNGHYSLLEFDNAINSYYIDILLDAPSPLPDESLTLKIDESFVVNTLPAIGKDLTFNEGDYLFDRNMGDFGGIRIYLD